MPLLIALPTQPIRTAPLDDVAALLLLGELRAFERLFARPAGPPPRPERR